MSGASYTVVAEGDGLLLVDKAAGVLTVGHGHRSQRCVLDDLRRDGWSVAPVHRLDRDTSGLLLLSLDPELREELQALFRGRQVLKQYLALVHGRPQPARATIDVPILDQGSTARVAHRGKRAVTHYEVLEDLSTAAGTASLVRARPETGRHNQIRVHLAHLGHPLLGDDKFGRRRRGPGHGAAQNGLAARRAMLHAERLAFSHPRTQERIDHTVPPPTDFDDLLATLRAAR